MVSGSGGADYASDWPGDDAEDWPAADLVDYGVGGDG